MKVNEYQELAMPTLNPELTKKDVLINSVMGLCGEICRLWIYQSGGITFRSRGTSGFTGQMPEFC